MIGKTLSIFFMTKRHSLITVIIVALLLLVGVLEVKRQSISAQLSSKDSALEEVQTQNQADNAKLAKQIVEEVRKLIDIPTDIEPTVATIVDVELLRTKNPFYDKAENGDHLIVTPNRAILYRASENKIIDVAPVQLEPVAGEGE